MNPLCEGCPDIMPNTIDPITLTRKKFRSRTMWVIDNRKKSCSSEDEKNILKETERDTFLQALGIRRNEKLIPKKRIKSRGSLSGRDTEKRELSRRLRHLPPEVSTPLIEIGTKCTEKIDKNSSLIAYFLFSGNEWHFSRKRGLNASSEPQKNRNQPQSEHVNGIIKRSVTFHPSVTILQTSEPLLPVEELRDTPNDTNERDILNELKCIFHVEPTASSSTLLKVCLNQVQKQEALIRQVNAMRGHLEDLVNYIDQIKVIMATIIARHP